MSNKQHAQTRRMFSRRLEDQVVMVTGADTEIGSATALAFAREGADLALVYGDNAAKVEGTRRSIERQGCRCLSIRGDLADKQFCDAAVYRTVKEFGRLDVLANNVTVHYPEWAFATMLSATEQSAQMEHALRAGIRALFQMARAGLTYIKDTHAIVSTLSVAVQHIGPRDLGLDARKSAQVAVASSLASTGLDIGMLTIPSDCGPEIRWRGEVYGDTTERHDEVVLTCMLQPVADGSSMKGQMLGARG